MMRSDPSAGPRKRGPYLFFLALLVLSPGLVGAQESPPGSPLSGGDNQDVCDALDALHCAVDAMDEEDPNRKKAEKALDAALKAKKGKKNPDTGQYETRLRKKTLERKGHDAFTTPEADDGKKVSGTEAVGEGNEFVVLGDKWLGGSGSAANASLAGLLAHEGVRLTQKYSYPRKGQSFKDKCGIVNRSLDAWGVHIAVLEALAGKETDPDEKKKIEDRIKDAEAAKDSWQKHKDALNKQQPGGCK
ncbi:MAG: hypothetical protein AAF604_15285 [Acidobacteriota bacterium]